MIGFYNLRADRAYVLIKYLLILYPIYNSDFQELTKHFFLTAQTLCRSRSHHHSRLHRRAETLSQARKRSDE